MTRVVHSVVTALALVAITAASLPACAASSNQTAALRVHAAASLTEAFGELAERFEGAEVSLTFGSSSSLSRQLADGADADVFASADAATMDAAEQDGSVVADSAVVFARNRLAILVEAGNPRAIRGLEDLAADDLTVVRCAPAVPCGRLADAVLADTGVDVAARSLEENVKGVVAKVALGEADAGLVYATDVVAAERVGNGEGVVIPSSHDTEFVVAVATATRRADAAEAWIDWIRSREGQQVLASYGFASP